jgi:hypothetical protein
MDKNETSIVYTIEFWLKAFGFEWYVDLAYIILLPFCLICATLNILAFIVLKGRNFIESPIYEYIRIYTLHSCALCLIFSTQFIFNCRRLIPFGNTEWATRYNVNFYIPMANIALLYQAFLDIVLSFDRVVLFSNRFRFYKKLAPKMVCLSFLVLTFIVTIYFWLVSTHHATELRLNDTEVYIMHHAALAVTARSYISNIVNGFTDGIPLIIEIPLNIATIILLRNYLVNRKKVRVTAAASSHVNPVNSQNTQNTQNERQKKMEVKVTVLVIFMSFISIL